MSSIAGETVSGYILGDIEDGQVEKIASSTFKSLFSNVLAGLETYVNLLTEIETGVAKENAARFTVRKNQIKLQ